MLRDGPAAPPPPEPGRGAPAPAADARSGARVLALRLFLVLMLLSTLSALCIVLSNWPAFATSFPGADSAPGRTAAIVLPLMLAAAVLGLLLWQRWALWLLGLATMGTLIFDIATRGPLLHLVVALTSTLSLGLLLWFNRTGFRRPGGAQAAE